jgi:hypothetical protein
MINSMLCDILHIAGKGPPRDGSVTKRHLQHVNITIYSVLGTIAALGIVLALTFLAINIKFRKHK